MKQKKMTAFLLSAAMAVSAFAAITVTASAEEPITIINGNYEILSATAYTEDSTKKLNTESWGFNVEYNNGWDDGNGIKIELPNMSGKKGTFAVSVDVKSYGWGDSESNTAKVFIENAEGVASDTVLEAYGGNEVADEYGGRTATISGNIEYDATAAGTYYLCIKHPSGSQQYQSISVTYTAAQEGEPSDGGDEGDSGNTIFAPNSAEAYAALAATPYDSAEAPFDGDLTFKDWGIEAKYNNSGYNGNTGVKIDITDVIKDKKGTFAVSADFTAYYWGDDLADGDEIASWNQVKLFLETADGTQTEIAQGPDTKNGNDAALSGEIEYDATAETTYYLCFKQPSSTHEYKNITIKYTAAGALSATVPVLTDTGAKTVISNTTDSDKEVFIYVVKGEQITLQTVTASANTGDEVVNINASENDTVYIWDDNQIPLTDKTVL